MKRTKYLHMQSGEWECTHIGLASVTGVYKKALVDGKRVRNLTYVGAVCAFVYLSHSV